MSKTISIPKSLNIFSSKKTDLLYREYCAVMAKESPDEQPMLSKDFVAHVDAEREKRIAYDKLTVAPKTKADLEAKGWAIKLHAPTTGPNKGKDGIYLVNDEATVNGSGFILMKRTRLEETRKRLLANVEAIDMVLKG